MAKSSKLLKFAEKSTDWMSRSGGVLVALGVIGIIGILIVPIPQALMDVLIGSNISLAVVILLVSLFVVDVTRIPSFPTILLLTTLFRLALNVSTTRLILTEADAGQIINAFGEFVVGGNVVVGGVIFLIITFIQFIVVAKGAERVSEVAARFSLDAMPGKQMTIDGEERSGAITREEAKDKRRALDRESKLYGAMEGAMKFVKGDAIAGIVISLVNVIGGLIIGIMQQGMTASEAGETFSLLTIGDGLVSQIPSLLITIGAGLIVTRVAQDVDAESSPVGGDIVRHFLSQPVALALVSLCLIAIGLFPGTGLPTNVFLSLGAVVGLFSVPRLPWLVKAIGSDACFNQEQTAKSESGADIVQLPYPEPIALELGESLFTLFRPNDEREARLLQKRLDQEKLRLESDCGVVIPPLNSRPSNLLAADEFATVIFNAPVYTGRFSGADVLVGRHVRDVGSLGLTAREVRRISGDEQCCSIPIAQVTQATEMELPLQTARDFVIEEALTALRINAYRFLGVHETQLLLDNLREHCPSLVDEVTPKILGLSQITSTLQQLLREQVPIVDLRLIVETMAKFGGQTTDPYQLVELVRRSMKHVLWARYSLDRHTLFVCSVSDEIEQLVEDAARIGEDGPDVNLDISLRNEIRRSLVSAIASYSSGPARNQTPVLMTRPQTRPFLRSIIADDYPMIAVLSGEEIPSNRNLQVRTIGRVALMSSSDSGELVALG